MLVIPYMAIMSGWSGGSLWGHQFFPKGTKWVPELLFALAFSYALFPVAGWWAILALVWSYLWMQTGHANALPWGQGGHNVNRENTLDPLVKWLCDKFGIEIFSVGYARLFMAVKGFLITLPVGGLGFILWPLGYEIGTRYNNNTIRETLAGAGAGLNIYLFMAVT